MNFTTLCSGPSKIQVYGSTMLMKSSHEDFCLKRFQKNIGKVFVFFLQDVFDPISVAPTPILAPCLLVISQLINPHWSSSRHVDAIWLKSNVCKLDPNIVWYQNNSPTTRMCSHCQYCEIANTYSFYNLFVSGENPMKTNWSKEVGKQYFRGTDK